MRPDPRRARSTDIDADPDDSMNSCGASLNRLVFQRRVEIAASHRRPDAAKCARSEIDTPKSWMMRLCNSNE